MTVQELAMRWAESPRILVVEQSTEAANKVVSALRRLNCQTDSVSALQVAKEAIARQNYALVLVSVDIPGCCDLVKAIQAKSPATPVLVATPGTERWLIGVLEEEKAAALRPVFQQTLRNTFSVLSVTTTA